MAEQGIAFRAELVNLLYAKDSDPATGLYHAIGQILVSPPTLQPEQVASMAQAALQAHLLELATTGGEPQDAEIALANLTVREVISQGAGPVDGKFGSMFYVSVSTPLPGQRAQLGDYLGRKAPGALALAALEYAKHTPDVPLADPANFPGYESIPLLPTPVAVGAG